MTGRIYVSGPMSGKHLWNFPAFFRAEAELKQDGWDVVNPARVDEEAGDVVVHRRPSHFWGAADGTGLIITAVELTASFDFRAAIERDLELVDGCDAIYLLRGWNESLGAQIELDRALRLGLSVLVEGGAEVPAWLADSPEQDTAVAFATDRDEEPGVEWEELDDPGPRFRLGGVHSEYVEELRDGGWHRVPEYVGFGRLSDWSPKDQHIVEFLYPVPEVDDTTNPKDLVGVTKPQVHLVPPAATVRIAEVMALGADKYGAYNWREKAVRSTVYVSAAFRHLMAYLDGETVDPESGQPHTAHVAACMAIILDAADHGNLIDDRPTPGPAGELIRELTVS